ncbi:hypothetical protein QLH51_15395 [Sphingomonas sp. 2R-10]|uniref:hypothetical protein n=1 Tax=Sphingomonas sp. 2R-10 TaxID=3045148 RepID=UPI000F774BDE|nr:hypothetical protein [Sphingomonas sp. 2R-10]MDJ0278183.1 hypothetical protein [Sphingomonas sp. 2R-10]
MRFVALIALPLTMIAAQPALAKGCLRGAAAGAVGGHMIGKGHGKLGAVAGCIAMHHHYAKQAKAQKAASQ